MIVLADPISIAIESETSFRSAFSPINEPVLAMIDIKTKKVNYYGPLRLSVTVHLPLLPKVYRQFAIVECRFQTDRELMPKEQKLEIGNVLTTHRLPVASQPPTALLAVADSLP